MPTNVDRVLAALAQALGIDGFDGADFGVFLPGRELDQPCLQAERGSRAEGATSGVTVEQCLGPGALWRAAHLQQPLQELAAFAIDHVLNLRSQLGERDFFLRRKHLWRHRLKRQGAHCMAADVAQALQRPDTRRMEATALEQAVHQQHAPAVRQRVIDRPRQSHLMGGEVLAQLWPVQGQRIS